jgi:hypothetical protein
MQTLEARGGVHHSEAQGVLPRPATAAIDLIRQFHDAPIQADFDQKVVAPVIGYSEGWLERMRVYGGGPAFVRLGGTFKINKNGERRIYGGKIRYPKTAVLEFLAKRRLVSSTSEYVEPEETTT